MKKLKIKFPYRIIFLIIISLFINNVYIYLIISLYILIYYRRWFLIYLIIIIIFIIYTQIDIINIGIVEEINDDYVIVNKVLYKCKLLNSNFKIGDVVFSKNSSKINDLIDLKNNIRFTINSDSYLLFNNRIKFNIYNYITNICNSDIYKKIFYNTYSSDVTNTFEYISLSYSFYYILIYVFRRNKYISIILLAIYSFLFGFQIKFLLILISFILSLFDIDNIERLSLKILILLFINKYLLLNYSFIYGILISTLIINNNGKLEPYLLALSQSFLYGNIKIINCLFYRYYIYEKIIMFFIATYSLIFKNNLIINYLTFSNNFFEKYSLTIRGKISIIVICFIFLIIKLFNIKKELYRLILVLTICLLPYNLLTKQIDFIDVGQGDSILLIDPSDFKTILIDTGSKYYYSRLKKELFNKGIYKIDYLIITHDDEDHNGNINSLKDDFNIGEIIQNGKDIQTNSLKLNYLNLNGAEYSNDNDSSLVFELLIDNYKVLFTGDISSNIENNIIFNYDIKDIDILKVSHHGSKTATSSYFVGSLNPEFAVISTSGMYGHPHKNVLDILDRYNVETFITKNDGCVNFVFTEIIDYIKTNNRFVIISK